ncbi:MAG TPA: prolyl oligopeptidase family serine peptidase [Vicinamibacterales bacterium]|jgi:dipeptidyl aminopeptidase/acylaminoacyl peptidase
MRKIWLLSGLGATLVYLAVASPAAQAPATSAYLTPPKVIADIMDAEPLPTVSLSPDRTVMLLAHRRSMPTIAEVAAPFLGLAGARVNPRTNGARVLGGTIALTFKDVATGTERKIALPAGGSFTASFSRDSKKVAITHTTDTGIRLLLADVASGSVRTLIDGGVNGLAGGCSWLDDSNGMLCRLIPDGRGAAPQDPGIPTGPNVQENLGGTAPGRTYQDLLTSAHEERLYDYYYTSQPAFVTLDGRKTTVGPPAVYASLSLSTDGQWLVVTRVKRPYSYVVPAGLFPRDVELWDRSGKVVRKLADVPMGDMIPTNGVFAGPRAFTWHALEPATLYWAEALDKGDIRNKVPQRDRVLALKAPFTGEPSEFLKTEWRYGGLQFTEKGVVLVSESDRASRMRRTWVQDTGAPRKAWELLQEDRYKDPGFPVFRPGTSLVMQVGDSIYLSGAGASPQGDRPFLDRFNLKTLKADRVWQSDTESYETVVAILDDNATRLITSRETKDLPANFVSRDLSAKTSRNLTSFKDPQPQLSDVQRQFVTYKRKDGVTLSGTIYLPPSYRPGTRLPMFVWAYPQEFTSADAASQVVGSPNRFTRAGGASHLLLLTQGYAIFDGPTMPIVGPGETANDTYIEQLVASAEAAVNFAVEKGIADRDRIGVGGHSYGAFMTANLLAHSDLFRAGIARSGAYNRSLTPFGFQNESRTFWEKPDLYARMSPFWHANKVNEPILLIHGEMDDNSGTFPIQSERFYMALKGHGATVRYITLPYEAHGYAARETNMHVITEMLNWLDKYVKNAKPRG